MATDVVMPQMGESIAEGTVTKWLKQVGDTIERDEPLLEISTDKVDTVIPSPAAGTITEIKVPEGETVPVQSVIAVLDGPAAESGDEGSKPAPEKEATESSPEPEAREAAEPAGARVPAPEPVPAAPVAAPPDDRGSENGDALSPVHPISGRVLTSPLVKRIARDEKVDLRRVPGTGMGGRVTRGDILGYLEQRKVGALERPRPATIGTLEIAPPSPAFEPKEFPGDRVEPMSNMRRLIAQHMVYSKQVSPHVYTMFEFDMTRVAQIRKQEKAAFEKTAGVKLTYMPFVARAVCHALQRNPLLNASVRGTDVIHHRNVNLGIAVAMDRGLIVPVIRAAEEKSFLGLARSIVDLADRARNKQLKPDEVEDGTFTITNPGVFGSLIGFAVINQPQVAILDMGAIVKRPVVVEVDGTDTIGIRHMQLISLSYDHRVVDGATADHFMNDVRDMLQGWNESLL